MQSQQLFNNLPTTDQMALFHLTNDLSPEKNTG